MYAKKVLEDLSSHFWLLWAINVNTLVTISARFYYDIGMVNL